MVVTAAVTMIPLELLNVFLVANTYVEFIIVVLVSKNWFAVMFVTPAEVTMDVLINVFQNASSCRDLSS